MKVAGWICVQPAIIVFEMLCLQIGTNLRKSFIVATSVEMRTDIIIFVPVCVVWSVKKPRRGVDSSEEKPKSGVWSS